MGIAASQARYLYLTARQINIEFEGQQLNQARTMLANQAAGLYNDLTQLECPSCPTQYEIKTKCEAWDENDPKGPDASKYPGGKDDPDYKNDCQIWDTYVSNGRDISKAYNDAVTIYNNEKTLYDQSSAEIEAKSQKIQQQDQALELQLRQLDTERQTITTELDSVKKVLDKNIEKIFKTFQD